MYVARTNKTAEHSRMDDEVRAALRPVLKREPTLTEMRHLRIAEAALGDEGMQRVQAKNSLEQLRTLRLLRGELLTEMRKNVRRLRRLRSKAQLQTPGKLSSRQK